MPRSRAVRFMRSSRPAWRRRYQARWSPSRRKVLPHRDVTRGGISPARLNLVGLRRLVGELFAVRRERRAAREARLRVAVAVQVVLPPLERAAARAVHELE